MVLHEVVGTIGAIVGLMGAGVGSTGSGVGSTGFGVGSTGFGVGSTGFGVGMSTGERVGDFVGGFVTGILSTASIKSLQNAKSSALRSDAWFSFSGTEDDAGQRVKEARNAVERKNFIVG